MRYSRRLRARVRTLTGRSLGIALVAGGCAVALATPASSATAAAGTDGAPAALTVTSPDLVFIQGTTGITLSSDQPSASWSVTDVTGGKVRSGTASFGNGTAAIGLAGLGPGYYTLTATAGSGPDATTRSASFAVLAPLPRGPLDQRFGVGIHLDFEDNPRWLGDAAKVGFGAARADVSWAEVEKSPGAYTYPAAEDTAVSDLHRLGITPLLIADYRNPAYDGDKTPSSPAALQAFAKFASDVLTHYAADTSQVEVYNEFNGAWFNNGACGTSADCYLPMLQAVYSRVKADHPGATVAGPAVSSPDTSWLGRLFQLGGLHSLNAVTVHDYTYPKPPEGLIDAQVGAARASINNAGGSGTPLWLDENGWSTYQGPKETSETNQADYVPRSEALALGNGAARYFYYDWINDGTNPADTESNFGLLRQPATGVTAASPKPALVTQAVLIRELDGLAYSGRDSIGANAYSYRFGSGGRTRRMLWTGDGGSQTVNVKADGPVTVTDEYGRTAIRWPSNGQVALTISQHPVYVAGAVTGVAASGDSGPCTCR